MSPTQLDPLRQLPRRRVVLGLVLAAELAAAASLISPATALTADSDDASTASTPPTTETASPPTSLVLNDGRTVHLLGLGGTATSALLGRIAAQIRAAVDAVVAFWGPAWQHDIVLVATETDAQFLALTHAPGGEQWVDIAAAAVAEKVDAAHHTASGQRVVFAPGAIAMTDYALRIVLRHELLHFAARADTAPDAPRWLTEGVADFVGRPAEPRPGAALANTLAKLPSDADFESSGPALSLAYDRAWWFARFIADTYGTTTLRNLYLRVGGFGHPRSADGIRQVLRIDQTAVLTRWRLWLAG